MIFQKATNQFAETILDDEVVLMNIDSGSFHALKGTGLAIWYLIDGQRDLVAIQTELQARYAVTAEACAPQVREFVDDLAKAGFVIPA
jgi:pyrroloquinoline quinone biosynthesis protein D